MKRVLLVITLLTLLSAALPAFAQEDTAPNPDAQITFPPPVFVLRGTFEIIGTANLSNMTSYFIEYRPLNDDLTPTNRDVWFPATLPSQSAVVDDVLGRWDTTLAGDGLYEIRLTVNVSSGDPVTQIITPLRVENEPSPFAIFSTPTPLPTATPLVPPTPTPVPPTPTPTTPRATITAAPAGNVRQGDSTAFGIIASLPVNSEVDIIGISNRGTGWFQVRLPNGQTGWVSPTIVSTTGDLSGLPRVQPPPPPPPTAAPLPTLPPAPINTPLPASQANLVAGIVVLEPAQPVCGQTFNVGFDVANLGTEPTISSGIVSLVDVRAADGSQQGSTIGGFPILQPGQTFRVNMPLTISTWYNEVHRITLTIDPNNEIPETQTGDNVRTIEYTLQQGSCP